MNCLVTVRTYGSRLEAEVAKSKLTAAGIPAIIFADDAGGLYPPSIFSGVSLKVLSEYADEAHRLLTFRSLKT